MVEPAARHRDRSDSTNHVADDMSAARSIVSSRLTRHRAWRACSAIGDLVPSPRTERRRAPVSLCLGSVLLLIDAAPMKFAATCDMCRVREEIEGTREEVVRRLGELAWRLDERFPRAIICAKCAGPPSVFPSAHIESDPPQCSACKAPVGVCIVCGGDFHETSVLSCRKKHGHAHGRCSTQKLRKFVPSE